MRASLFLLSMAVAMVLSADSVKDIKESEDKKMTEKEDAKEEVVKANSTHGRVGKQFWQLFHPGISPVYPAAAVAPLELYQPLTMHHPHVYKATNPATTNVSARVADTRDHKSSSSPTPEDQKVIVESVNQLLGAVHQQQQHLQQEVKEQPGQEEKKEEKVEGRQGINGANIYSADEEAEAVLPGRPNAAIATLPGAEISPGGGGGSNNQLSGPEILPTKGNRKQECCLFVFFDGSAFYFDEYLRLLTGPYRLMYGTVNGHPHYVARGCKQAELYGANCSYIWNSGYGWIVGIGTYIGQTKGVVYTRSEHSCPSDPAAKWRYLNKDLEWKDNGNVYVECAS